MLDKIKHLQEQQKLAAKNGNNERALQLARQIRNLVTEAKAEQIDEKTRAEKRTQRARIVSAANRLAHRSGAEVTRTGRAYGDAKVRYYELKGNPPGPKASDHDREDYEPRLAIRKAIKKVSERDYETALGRYISRRQQLIGRMKKVGIKTVREGASDWLENKLANSAKKETQGVIDDALIARAAKHVHHVHNKGEGLNALEIGRIAGAWIQQHHPDKGPEATHPHQSKGHAKLGYHSSIGQRVADVLRQKHGWEDGSRKSQYGGREYSLNKVTEETDPKKKVLAHLRRKNRALASGDREKAKEHLAAAEKIAGKDTALEVERELAKKRIMVGLKRAGKGPAVEETLDEVLKHGTKIGGWEVNVDDNSDDDRTAYSTSLSRKRGKDVHVVSLPKDVTTAEDVKKHLESNPEVKVHTPPANGSGAYSIKSVKLNDLKEEYDGKDFLEDKHKRDINKHKRDIKRNNNKQRQIDRDHERQRQKDFAIEQQKGKEYRLRRAALYTQRRAKGYGSYPGMKNESKMDADTSKPSHPLHSFFQEFPEAKEAFYNAASHFRYADDATDHVCGQVYHKMGYDEFKKIIPHLKNHFLAHGLED